MDQLTHLVRLTDDCGIWQHATHAVPDRRHGYCLDDVRALWLCGRRADLDAADAVAGRLAAILALAEVAASPLPEGLTGWALGALRRAESLDLGIDIDGLARPLARRLMDRWVAAATAEWPFFESYLSYDSPRLAQGALDGATWVPELADAGLAAVAWLSRIQTSPDG